MRYSRVYVDAIGYELPPVVVTSTELETRLTGFYEALRIPQGQLEALTGIVERRWWDEGYPVSEGAIAAAKQALATSNVKPEEIGVLIYAGVCRELFEPATACRVAAGVGVGEETAVYDISNACLGVLNGMIDIANRIELGQIKAGMVVSCETAREINDIMIERMIQEPTMENFRESLATLTGGSGAVAMLLTDGSFSEPKRRRLLGGVTHTAPQFHALCRWGLEAIRPLGGLQQFMATDSISVLKHGVDLGTRTWSAFLRKFGWMRNQIDKVICHQVGSGHRDTILQSLGIDPAKEFSSFPYLGNIGTVSLPLTAALAEDRDFLQPGDRVAFLGIGSGLNCLMLGLEW
ncbi:3-oxoacyl-[acyl-carrier-protein] synthase-3 [Singulisphaera sp. GP187]|uniref:3-oxoacyl-ACP synthase III n=1 Tax=Singulisphaera sp. GP187 TaxID=1882752 RepID=UPI00092BC609|nr:3-oxoacyl-ACP synthase III [Singulisphaera sp. GP187]SIO57147.1 3-oxoacyl-[acyl-carrier-protein] synthase-3 [Singulisphaera sp. GP187]